MFRIFANAALAVSIATAGHSMENGVPALVDAEESAVGATVGAACTTMGGTLSTDLDNASAVQAACQLIMARYSLTEDQLIKLAARLEAHLEIDRLSPQELRDKKDCYLVDAMPEGEFCAKVAEIGALMSTWTAGTEDPDTAKITDDLDGIGVTLKSWNRVWKRLQKTQMRSMPGYIEKTPAELRKARYKQLRVVEKLEETMPPEMLRSLPTLTMRTLPPINAIISPTSDIDRLHGDDVNKICINVTSGLDEAHFVRLVAKFEENRKIAEISTSAVLNASE